ncbi:SdrD B-like domain-containing protein [Chryseobacterium sp. CT-SW4]|uniref:SdrD B-like domain-containing protein n=1 Tax=Chryseobacterium sp. SW-1 TaxID=3157343 RepID=UPI003B02EC57
MKKIYFTLFSLCFSVAVFSQSNEITSVYTDYNNGTNSVWNSSVGNISSVRPDNSHNLLAFEWKGTYYTTGVNDPLVSGSLATYTPLTFQSVPVNKLPDPTNDTYIGVGNMYGGYPGSSSAPIPVVNNMEIYLSDGVRGLDMGTAIFNPPPSSDVEYDVVSINPASIGDGIPDIIITQMGQPSGSPDIFEFEDINGNTVGNSVDIIFNNVSVVGEASWKFYNASTAAYVPGLQGSREMRLLAFDWSDFGLTDLNISDIEHFIQIFSGSSDPAFTAYNTESFTIKQNVAGFIFNDNNAGTPDGNGMEGVEVRLFQNGIQIESTTTDFAGAYFFNNLNPGDYTGQVILPPNFYVVGNALGNTSDSISGTITASTSYSQVNFGLNEPPVAIDDIINAAYSGATISKNISQNDVDPNSGNVVSSTVHYVNLPAGATNISYDTSGEIIEFTVPGEGTWSLDSSYNAIFTPETSFLGNTTTVYYTIRDMAGLLSNVASIDAEVVDYCTKAPLITSGGTPSRFGITSLTTKAPGWPQNVPNGQIVLESHNKGLVITRVSDETAITDPKEGMLIYDIAANCVKLYNGTAWHCIERSCNE